MSQLSVMQMVASSHGGGAAHVRDLATGLSRDAFRVMVAMSEDRGNVPASAFTEAGIPFIPLSIGRGVAWRAPLEIRRLLRRHQVDILHVHGARAALYGRAATMTMRPRPRLVFTIHGFATPYYANPKRATYLLLERLLQRVTDVTVCVAQAEAEAFIAAGLAPAAKVRVVHPGIDVERFAGRAPPPPSLADDLGTTDRRVVLCACRLHVPRDFGTLLEAWKRVTAMIPAVHLLIAGDGPQRASIERQIGEQGLEAQASLTGYRDDVPALMAMAEVFVLTSSGWEGYPISTLEAQAAGVPAVVTDAGGSREAVLHQVTGLVVPKSDPDALAEALVTLLGDADLRGRLGAAGRERARREFGCDRMVARLSGIYRTLA